jgi:hypothetical protein
MSGFILWAVYNHFACGTRANAGPPAARVLANGPSARQRTGDERMPELRFEGGS